MLNKIMWHALDRKDWVKLTVTKNVQTYKSFCIYFMNKYVIKVLRFPLPPIMGKAFRTLAYLESCMVRASISSCFLVPVVRIPNCLHASFSTGTVSLPKVPFATWFFISSSDISIFGFFSAPPPDSAVQKDEIIQDSVSVILQSFWK